MKTHKPDVGNTMLLGIFLVESISKDSVRMDLVVHGGISDSNRSWMVLLITAPYQ